MPERRKREGSHGRRVVAFSRSQGNRGTPIDGEGRKRAPKLLGGKDWRQRNRAPGKPLLRKKKKCKKLGMESELHGKKIAIL